MDFDEATESRPELKFDISPAWVLAGFTGALLIACGVLAGIYFGLPVYPFLGVYKSLPPIGVSGGSGVRHGFSVGWPGRWKARFYRTDESKEFAGELKGRIDVSGKILRDGILVTDAKEVSVPVELEHGNRVMLHVKASTDMTGKGYCAFEVPAGTPSAPFITAGKLSALFFLFAGAILDLFFLAYFVRRRQVLTAIERVSDKYRAQESD